MITKFSKWILYVSSYIPLYLIFIVSNIFDIYSKYNIIKNDEKYNIYFLISNTKINLIIIGIFLGIICTSLMLLKLILKKSSTSNTFHEFYSVRKNNEKINEYVLVYIIPFITVKSNDCKEITVFALLFLLIGIISVKNDLVYVNPVLYMMKYNIYLFKDNPQTCEETVLITQYSIIDLKQVGIWNSDINCIKIKSSSLSDKVYLIKKQ
ncbi:hypothetical protein FDB14_18620 [Clostridium botulinum]|nr:hypothetical protein [Clostridium botulinum]NFK70059.1 hypothetical protein [Clostridium botulinum]NFK98163.1 hypothetical protein [Clostridium botulinum]